MLNSDITIMNLLRFMVKKIRLSVVFASIKVGEPYYSYYGYEYAGVDPNTGRESYYINDGTSNARNTTVNPNEAKKLL